MLLLNSLLALFLQPQRLVGIPQTFNLRTDILTIADAVATVADCIDRGSPRCGADTAEKGHRTTAERIVLCPEVFLLAENFQFEITLLEGKKAQPSRFRPLIPTDVLAVSVGTDRPTGLDHAASQLDSCCACWPLLPDLVRAAQLRSGWIWSKVG